jgi:hypothetical protein
MKLTNVSGCEAAWTSGYEPDGREMLIVIVKDTYVLPRAGEQPERADARVPLVQADVFTGVPGVSAPRYESDFAHRKPFCDVIVVGSAHAPHGEPAPRVMVSLEVGTVRKRFAVVGDRVWQRTIAGVSATRPHEFLVMPVTYDVAFGGTDRTLESRGGEVFTYTANPVGRGYWQETSEIDGKPLPNTEGPDEPIVSHRAAYVPFSFSPVGRNWSPRYQHAGTYDQGWLDDVAPFWPHDFDYRYFQCAPGDQWITYPSGGEPIVLNGLTPDGHRSFQLPARSMPVTFIPHSGHDVTQEAVVDTIVLEPDQDRFTLTWRTSLALGRSLFDVKEIIAGEMPAGWYRARKAEKDYYVSLSALAAGEPWEPAP